MWELPTENSYALDMGHIKSRLLVVPPPEAGTQCICSSFLLGHNGMCPSNWNVSLPFVPWRDPLRRVLEWGYRD